MSIPPTDDGAGGGVNGGGGATNGGGGATNGGGGTTNGGGGTTNGGGGTTNGGRAGATGGGASTGGGGATSTAGSGGTGTAGTGGSGGTGGTTTTGGTGGTTSTGGTGGTTSTGGTGGTTSTGGTGGTTNTGGTGGTTSTGGTGGTGGTGTGGVGGAAALGLYGAFESLGGRKLRVTYDFENPAQLNDFPAELGRLNGNPVLTSVTIVENGSNRLRIAGYEVSLARWKLALHVTRLAFKARVTSGQPHLNWYTDAVYDAALPSAWLLPKGAGGILTPGGTYPNPMFVIDGVSSPAALPLAAVDTDYLIDIAVGAQVEWNLKTVTPSNSTTVTIAAPLVNYDRHTFLGTFGCSVELDDLVIEGELAP